jgi:hypothetical protein
MYTRLQLGLFAALAALGVTFSEGNAADNAKKNANAVKSSTPVKPTSTAAAPTAKGTQKAFNKAHHASVLSELHQAKHLLDIALHDYHGHRARADHEIHKAIHLLEHGEHHKGEHKSNFKATPHDGPISGETQSQSDSKLRQAEKLVHAAHRQLEQLHVKHGHKRYEEAAHLLKKAAHEIEEALHVVHNYNEHHKKAVAAVVK